MNTKAIFHCGGGSNLILGIGREKKIFFLRTPATVKFFPQIVRKMILWCKKKSLPTQVDLYNTYGPLHYSLGEFKFSKEY